MYQVLLVEDDAQIREVITEYFNGKEEIQISIARDGEEGLDFVYETEYDLILLDIMMPGLDGFQLCREIRKNSIVPIIFLTARGREEDVLYGYDLGCDDYIVKPFSLAELYAKVKALLNRSKGLVGTRLLQCGKICVNPATLTVTVEGNEVILPPKEYSILKYLLEHKGVLVERETLLTRIWGYDYEGNERVVDNRIKNLRKELGDAGKQIRTIITKGYRMEE
ncbi:MAG: response regulator transcription factor [Lachnospiraceae bacterium]|nr:response regulator transcription factor [Lachnospiraceae bacterium]